MSGCCETPVIVPGEISEMKKPKAFTLIELLIVVAIIGILVAIAIPNFLTAQVRAKVSRAKADMATITTGLETYFVDWNDYSPNDGIYNVVPIELTQPVSYLTIRAIVDPFAEYLKKPLPDPEHAKWYTYARIVDTITAAGPPPVEAIDHPAFNPGAFSKYGNWRMCSVGPDQLYSDPFSGLHSFPVFGSDVPYDPTNGTSSFGNILRTQKTSLVKINLSK